MSSHLGGCVLPAGKLASFSRYPLCYVFRRFGSHLPSPRSLAARAEKLMDKWYLFLFFHFVDTVYENAALSYVSFTVAERPWIERMISSPSLSAWPLGHKMHLVHCLIGRCLCQEWIDSLWQDLLQLLNWIRAFVDLILLVHTELPNRSFKAVDHQMFCYQQLFRTWLLSKNERIVQRLERGRWLHLFADMLRLGRWIELLFDVCFSFAHCFSCVCSFWHCGVVDSRSFLVGQRTDTP